MTKKKQTPAALDDAALDAASGGLPAVQVIREAGRTSSGVTKTGTGTVVFASANTYNGSEPGETLGDGSV